MSNIDPKMIQKIAPIAVAWRKKTEAALRHVAQFEGRVAQIARWRTSRAARSIAGIRLFDSLLSDAIGFMASSVGRAMYAEHVMVAGSQVALSPPNHPAPGQSKVL